MTITVQPTHFEIYDGEELLAKVEMFDEGASHVDIKTVVSPSNWHDLSVAITQALEKLHPEKQT